MQVSKHIHAVRIPFEICLPDGMKLKRFVYVYFIYTSSNIYLIDTGVASAESVIFDYILKSGRKPDEIALIILTHAHPDHIGAAKAIKKETGCTVAVHRDEKAWIEDVEQQFKERPVPGFHSLVGGSVSVDSILNEKDILDLGDGLNLEVFHTSGHSKGSISLLLNQDRALFAGDAIPRTGDMPIYEDAVATIESIRKLQSIPKVEVLLSSWDDPVMGTAVYQKMEERLGYLQKIHEIVSRNANTTNSKERCAAVLKELGLPAMLANPLIARSIESHLR